MAADKQSINLDNSTQTKSEQTKVVSMRLQIHEDNKNNQTISLKNLTHIKRFIVDGRKKQTFCTMYNNNPYHKTSHYSFYLLPDSGQNNIDCDITKSDFNTLVIHDYNAKNDQYRKVQFFEGQIYINSDWPIPDMTVRKVLEFTESAIMEILTEINKDK